MKWISRIFILLFITTLPARSQIWKMRRWELQGGIGTGHYFGDIGGVSPSENLLGLKDISLVTTRPVFNVGMRYKIGANRSVNARFFTGWLHGQDAGGVNDARGIVFNTFIFEPSVMFEQNIIPDKSNKSYLMMKGRGIISFTSSLSVYAFAGIGGSLFFPKVVDDPFNRLDLSASKIALVFPMGLGLKYPIDPNFSLGFTLGARLTTTDEIDGFTSPYSKHKDIYYFSSFHLIWKLRTSRQGWPLFKL
ncbi:MAG: hypothetical protein GXO83_05280 [Chlorobi bacterium]|nr:hypothetical protein [Chlorobiota bacterium]